MGNARLDKEKLVTSLAWGEFQNCDDDTTNQKDTIFRSSCWKRTLDSKIISLFSMFGLAVRWEDL